MRVDVRSRDEAPRRSPRRGGSALARLRKSPRVYFARSVDRQRHPADGGGRGDRGHQRRPAAFVRSASANRCGTRCRGTARPRGQRLLRQPQYLGRLCRKHRPNGGYGGRENAQRVWHARAQRYRHHVVADVECHAGNQSERQDGASVGVQRRASHARLGFAFHSGAAVMSETSKRRNVQTSKGARRRPLARPGALDVGDRFGCLDVWTFRRLHSRGLTLLELLLAMTITVMIGAGMVAMLGAVNSGVGDRRDTRLTMMRAAAARSRITDYLGPSRCVLAISGANLTLWLADTRKSGTVHAT